MDEFSGGIDRWHDFFTMTGGAAATLMGLLFVAISMRKDLRSNRDGSFRRQALTHSFLNYLFVLLFSMYFLVPDLAHRDLGWTILITCLFPIGTHIRLLWQARGGAGLTGDDLFWVFVIPISCYVAGIGVAIALIRDDDTEIYWFLPIVALLLSVPTRNAWDLVLGSSDSG